MRKSVSILLGFAMILFTGCGTADQKIPEIAGDFCNCFADMEKNMGAKSKEIMEKASSAANPTLTIASELQKLSEEDQQTVSNEMMALGEMENKNSEVGRCMAAVEKKYGKEKTFNEKKFMENLIKELESKKGCDLTATLMKIGLKAKPMKD